MDPAVFDEATWRKSSRSNTNGDCVEVGTAGNQPEVAVGVRDSKDRGGGILTVSAPAWTAFLATLA